MNAVLCKISDLYTNGEIPKDKLFTLEFVVCNFNII